MATIETKYGPGDKVYIPSSVYEDVYESCPDCLGEKKVHITFADKRVEEMDCYTCRSHGFPEVSTGTLKFKQYLPKVESGTILTIELEDGKVKYKVDEGYQKFDDGQYRQCTWTRNEDILFLTHAEALEKAEIMNVEQMAYIAECNFKTKGSFAEKLQRSSWGFSRKQALKLDSEMKMWIKAIRGKK